MDRRRRLLVIIGVGTIGVLLLGFGVYWFLLRSDAPDPVSLDAAVAAATSSTTLGDDTAATGSSSTTSVASGPIEVEGEWVVTPVPDSFVGYRVREELARIGFTEAAGRTGELDASMVIADGAVTSVEVTVDMTTLSSDDDRRDNQMRTQALETNEYPASSFSLTQPITLPRGTTEGEEFAVTAVGELTLHGVTNPVEIDLEAELVGDTIVVVGSAGILFADYAIEQPTSMVLLSVDDQGVMEFQLLFERS